MRWTETALAWRGRKRMEDTEILRRLELLRVEHRDLDAAIELLVRMRQGQSLSHALARAGHLSGAALTLSRVAERNGIWATQMGDWLQQREQDAQWRRQVRSALAYPAGVLLLALMVMAGVITWVLPTFEAFYGQLQSELPAPTRWLLDTRQFIWAWGDGLALAVLTLSLGFAWGVRRPAGAKLWDAWHWRLPGLGHWRQMRVESSWCRLIAQWVEAGLDWDQALAMASAAVDSPVMVQAGAAIRVQDVKQLLETAEQLLQHTGDHAKAEFAWHQFFHQLG